MKKEPAGLKSTKNQSPSPAMETKSDDYNFSTESKYKKFTDLLKESNKVKQQQQQQQQKIECNCWVCKILDSSSITDKTTTAQYEDYNIVSETGDSIFYDPFLSNIFDNENKLAGEIYIAEDKIRNIIQDELAKKHYNGGVNFNKNE